VIDIRHLKEEVGISNEDVAKRLIDHGFHAPTMSFPVAGTLMVEPTESESYAELERFCEAMLAIRAEIDRVAAGEWPVEDNPLVTSPHPAEDLVADRLGPPLHPRGGRVPARRGRADKYWPPVSRIDNAYGDRHLQCACPPIEAFDDGS
jgi:glycine dehydrogenase